MDLKNYGFRIDNLKESALPYTLLLFAFIPLVLIFKYWEQPLLNLYKSMYPSIFLSVGGSIFQEIFFRGILIYYLKLKFKSSLIVIIISSFLFSLMHVFIPLQYIFVPLSFIIGLGFGYVYYKYPNIYLASLVHIIMNLVVPMGYMMKVF